MSDHRCCAVTRQQPEIDQGLRLARQRVVLVAAPYLRDRRGGANQGVRGRARFQLPAHDGPEQPQVRHGDPLEAREFRRNGVKHLRRDAGNRRRHGRGLNALDGGRERSNGRARRWHRGVARGGVRRQAKRDRALFRDANQGRWRLESRQYSFRNEQPLIQGKLTVHATLGQQPGNLAGTFRATVLLVVAERQIDRAPRLKATGDQRLDRLEDGHHVALVIPAAATPYEPIADIAGEWTGVPVPFRSGRHRDDILMGHQQDRLRRWILARPGIEEAVAVHDLALQDRVKVRERTFEVSAKFEQLGQSFRRRVLKRYGAKSNRPGEPRRHGPAIDRNRRQGTHRDLLRTVSQGVDRKYERDGRDNGNECERCAPNHGATRGNRELGTQLAQDSVLELLGLGARELARVLEWNLIGRLDFRRAR